MPIVFSQSTREKVMPTRCAFLQAATTMAAGGVSIFQAEPLDVLRCL